jgi:hypothetical protein
MSNRNKRVQITPNVIVTHDSDGNVVSKRLDGNKVIFHEKETPNDGFKLFWNQLNQSPRKNSKRQQRLRAEEEQKKLAEEEKTIQLHRL